MRSIILTILCLVNIFSASAAHADNSNRFLSKYIGQENREIKSLSEEDIKELSTGSGWGLAKVAELNGLPGPKHILEMKEKIQLSKEQEQGIMRLFETMHERAVELGHVFIGLEKELNNRFATKTIDEKVLRELLEKLSKTHMELRFVHLSTHLKTPNILSKSQIEKYNRLRGYFAENPCRDIPKGHDPVMWRKHNNCE